MERICCPKCKLDRWTMDDTQEVMVLDLEGEYVDHDDACLEIALSENAAERLTRQLMEAKEKMRAMEAGVRWKIPIPVGFVYQCQGCLRVFVTRMNVTPNDGSADPYRPPMCCGEMKHIASCDPWIVLERIGNGESFSEVCDGRLSNTKTTTRNPGEVKTGKMEVGCKDTLSGQDEPVQEQARTET